MVTTARNTKARGQDPACRSCLVIPTSAPLPFNQTAREMWPWKGLCLKPVQIWQIEISPLLFVFCRLGLKDQQEREIVHVLMDCCLQEKTYNPFYAFLASKFCDYERRFQVTC